MSTFTRIVASIVLIGSGLWFMSSVLQMHSSESSHNFANTRETYSNQFSSFDKDLEDFHKSFTKGAGFSSRTISLKSSTSSVIDSLEKTWSGPYFDPLKNMPYEYIDPLSTPIIERKISENSGFITYTLLFVASKNTDSLAEDSLTILVYNQTALVNQQNDSLSVLSIYETEKPIPWMQFIQRIGFSDTASAESDLMPPYPGSKMVLRYGEAGSTGKVYACWLPCSADSATEYYVSKLKKAGWQTTKYSEGTTILLTRGHSPMETLAISSIGESQDSSSLIVISFQGFDGPFSVRH